MHCNKSKKAQAPLYQRKSSWSHLSRQSLRLRIAAQTAARDSMEFVMGNRIALPENLLANIVSTFAKMVGTHAAVVAVALRADGAFTTAKVGSAWYHCIKALP
jgi:hypothetical protein